MADPITVGGFIKFATWLRSLGSFLPTGGGPHALIKAGIAAAHPVTEAGTLGTVPFPSTPPLLPVPPSPGAPSIPDVPGRVATGAASTFLRSWWIGALFYPSANPRGRGSQLCIETEIGPWCPPGLPNVDAAMPAPVAVPGSRGRRRPRVIPGAPGRRRRAARPLAVPQGPPRPRGRPVSLSRPRVEVSPATAAVIRSPPSSARPPMPASIPQAQQVSLPGTISAPVPRAIPTVQAPPTQVPSWVRELARLAPAVLGVPLLGNWVGAPNVRPNLPSSRPGQIPGLGSIPGVGPTPALNPALAPLTAFNPAAAHSPAQELDRQCKERAKQRRKKRKPRSECWKGSYVETRKGTRKTRREKIRCQ